MRRLAFVDLDGVLCDFVTGAIQYHKLTVDPATVSWDFWKECGMTDGDFWTPLGELFWRSLEPTPECFDLMETVLKFYPTKDVFLCSSHCLTPGCVGQVKHCG